jgi:tRNA-Thr(GGU) m(6)t(6)A37 methyltransferase TsaA
MVVDDGGQAGERHERDATETEGDTPEEVAHVNPASPRFSGTDPDRRSRSGDCERPPSPALPKVSAPGLRETAAMEIVLTPVAHVVGGRADAFDDDWDAVVATIALAERFGPESLAGLEAFSHVEVVYHFHGVSEDDVVLTARHPRGRTDWPKVGIFAQRGKNRPNRIGVSRCRLLRVDGLEVHVEGLDAVDGTPVLDIKPYMTEFGPQGATRQPEWATAIMSSYY